MKGCDYSFARPSIADLKSLGITWAGRYLTGSGKALTGPEAQQLLGAGLGILLVFEAGAGNALQGQAQGQADGQAAKTAAAAVGAPETAALFFTVDENTTDLADVESYARAFAAAVAPHPCGAYAEGAVLAHLDPLDFVRYLWQTAATGWFGGRYNGADIDQGGAALSGAIDLDDTPTADFGAWWPQSSPVAQPATAPDTLRCTLTEGTLMHVDVHIPAGLVTASGLGTVDISLPAGAVPGQAALNGSDAFDSNGPTEAFAFTGVRQHGTNPDGTVIWRCNFAHAPGECDIHVLVSSP